MAPLYGVLGNHESEMIYGGVDDQLAEKFSEAGVQLLRNETRTIQIGENNVELIGLEGALKDFYKYGASDCVESLSRQYDTFRICINHVPMAFVDYMQDAPFDLALAGHTHGWPDPPAGAGAAVHRRGGAVPGVCGRHVPAGQRGTPHRGLRPGRLQPDPPRYTIRRSWFWWM